MRWCFVYRSRRERWMTLAAAFARRQAAGPPTLAVSRMCHTSTMAREGDDSFPTEAGANGRSWIQRVLPRTSSVQVRHVAAAAKTAISRKSFDARRLGPARFPAAAGRGSSWKAGEPGDGGSTRTIGHEEFSVP